MCIFNELQGPLPASWIGHTRWIISVKLKLWTDRRHAPYHNTTDFRLAYKNRGVLFQNCKKCLGTTDCKYMEDIFLRLPDYQLVSSCTEQSSSGCIQSARQPIPGKISNNEIESPFRSVRSRTCAEHCIHLSFTRFSPSDLFSAGQLSGFLATATPFRTWRYQLIIR